MKILINTASTLKGGGVQVAKSILEESKNFEQYEFHVILGVKLAQEITPSDFPGHFTFYFIDYRPATRIFGGKRAGAFMEAVEKSVRPDVVFTTSGPAYWRSNAPHLIGYNLPHYIYRDSPFFGMLSLRQRLKWDLKGLAIRYFYKRDADAIVGQTSDVAERAGRWLGIPEYYTVSNTCSAYYRNYKGKPTKKLPPQKEGEFRLLTLSGYYKHKNLEIINQIVPLLSSKGLDNIRFVLTLPQEDYEQHIEPGVRSHVLNVGSVPISEGPALYAECDAMFLPTLLECFSASYPEAMAMSKPILTSDLSFARSICGNAALYFDPLSARDAVDQIAILADRSSDIPAKLVQNGKKRMKEFNSPKERALSYLRICEGLLAKQSIL